MDLALDLFIIFYQDNPGNINEQQKAGKHQKTVGKSENSGVLFLIRNFLIK